MYEWLKISIHIHIYVYVYVEYEIIKKKEMIKRFSRFKFSSIKTGYYMRDRLILFS